MYVPNEQTSRASRELTMQIDHAIRAYRTEHPKTSTADVQMALEAARHHAAGHGGLSPARAVLVAVAICITSLAIGVAAYVVSGAEANVVWLLLASFVVVTLLAVFIMARRHG